MTAWAGALLAAAALLAGCSNHSGLSRHRPTGPASSAISLPGGLAGSPSPTAAASSSSGSPTRSSSPTASHPPTAPGGSSGATASPAAASRTSRHHAPPPRTSSSPRRTPSPPASSAPSGPAVGASPDSGLKGGQAVTVSGVRFGPGEKVDVRQCRSGLTTCNLTGTAVTAGAHGSFTARVIVAANFFGACRASGCVIRVHRADGTNLVAPLRFG
jgi:hypothetical protein